MAERKSLSKKTRFEVFKRDSFECQYCGAHPPSTILHVDHGERYAAIHKIDAFVGGAVGGHAASVALRAARSAARRSASSVSAT